MRDVLGLDTFAASGPEAVARAADVLVTATPARGAIVMDGWVQPGAHVTALGSDGPGKQELDPNLVARADVFVVDRLSQCRRLGELQHALAARLMREEDVHAELGEIVAGKKRGRSHDRQVTIVDLTGVGFQDTAIASLAYERLAARSRT
jgi:ornithine cyclodeaminase